MRKKFFSVDGDVSSIAVVIRRWLEKHDRLLSPKFLVGESYGGIRGPKVVRNLQTEQGVGVRGLILISPVLDFRDRSGSSILQYVASLPSYAAVARQAKAPATARSPAPILPMSSVMRAAISCSIWSRARPTSRPPTGSPTRWRQLTGIDQAVSRRLAGRFDITEFRREFDRKNGKVTGRYDASVLGDDPNPDSSFFHFDDQSGECADRADDQRRRRSDDAQAELAAGRLLRARERSGERDWDFGRGLKPAESVSQLRQVLALDPKLKVLVAHGLFDLATPYFGSKIVLDQLPAYAAPPRVKLVVYPGGHMFYSRDASRQAFRAEAEALMQP